MDEMPSLRPCTVNYSAGLYNRLISCYMRMKAGTPKLTYSMLGNITKTYLYNFDPLKPQFHIVKLGFTWVYIIFLISAQKHRL